MSPEMIAFSVGGIVSLTAFVVGLILGAAAARLGK